MARLVRIQTIPSQRMTSSPPPQITWISSYPKSGNTWVRFMLYAAIYGPPERSIDINRKIADIHRKSELDTPDPTLPLLCKTHFELTDAHPELANTKGAIHIIRNPRDVLLSALNYHRLTGVTDQQLPDHAYAQAFIAHGGDPMYKQLGFGTWASHARSWRTTERFPVLALRYEDLKADPRAALVTMLDFLELDLDDTRIDNAIKASAFDAMRALEIREKKQAPNQDLSKRLFVGDKRATSKGVYFMNSGSTNQKLDALAPGLDERFNAKLKPLLDEFGYAD